MKRGYSKLLYNQRNKNETIVSVIKRLFGEHITSRLVKTQNRELSFRCIAYNIHRLTNLIIIFNGFYWATYTVTLLNSTLSLEIYKVWLRYLLQYGMVFLVDRLMLRPEIVFYRRPFRFYINSSPNPNPNQLIKLYAKRMFPTLLLIERWDGSLKGSCL